jgi:multiple sugar transport system substrate-binding protein
MKIEHKGSILAGLLISFLLANCSRPPAESLTPSPEEESPLTIWWERGYYAQQDEAIETIVEQWQRETGQTAELIFIDQDDILRQVNRTAQNNTLPDILFSNLVNQNLSARWAWEGKLADVSGTIASIKNLYEPEALKAAEAYNALTQTHSIYAIPIHQQTDHIHYWQPLLTQVGLNGDEIPTQWDEFWLFWQQAQDRLRAQGENDIYAIGLPMSSRAIDTHYAFQFVLDAYDVELWDDAGDFRGDNPQVRQGLINALNWCHDLYEAGYVPPDAVHWTNSDNNTVFLNQNTLMVINPTLSIPASQREDEAIYQNQMVTLPFPQEPDGEPLKSARVFKFVIHFADAEHPELTEDFLTYLIQPDNLGNYLETSLGRYFPVIPQLLDQPFWNDPADPHVRVATQQIRNGTISPASSLALALESVWGQALERVIVDGISAENSADEAINQVKTILSQPNQ